MSSARRIFEDKIRSALTERYMKDAIDAFLHELAEEIRLTADENCDQYTPGGMHHAADLIDPKKEN